MTEQTSERNELTKAINRLWLWVKRPKQATPKLFIIWCCVSFEFNKQGEKMKKYNWLYNDCINMGETFNLLKVVKIINKLDEPYQDGSIKEDRTKKLYASFDIEKLGLKSTKKSELELQRLLYIATLYAMKNADFRELLQLDK